MECSRAHEPIVTALEPGTVRYCVKGQWDDVIVGQGFAEVMPDYAILLVSTAERPGEIDKARAERAKAHAEECLRQKQSVQEYHRSKAGPGQGNGTAESGGQITGLGFEKKRGVSSWERNTAFPVYLAGFKRAAMEREWEKLAEIETGWEGIE